MTVYIIRRILLMIPTLLGITALVFFVMKAAPGDVAEMLISREGQMQPGDRQARLEYIRQRYGLDQPAIVQFGRWMNRVSPLGFQTSSQIEFDDDAMNKAYAKLTKQAPAFGKLSEGRARKAIRNGAAYMSVEPDAIVDRFIRADGDVEATLDFLIEIEAFEKDDLAEQEAAPAANEGSTFGASDRGEARRKFVRDLRATAAADPAKGKEMAAERLAQEASSLDRVLFTRPLLKEPDFGHSFVKNRPVTELLGESIPITVLLNLLSLPIVYMLAITTGVHAARHRGGVFDVSSGLTMIVLYAIPTIWAGVMLQLLFANKNILSLFPTSGLHDLRANEMSFLPRWTSEGFERGYLLDMAWHLVLPVICLGYGSFAFMGKLARGSVLENITADYVRTARAKGLSGNVVLWRHAFRNSLLPLITVAAYIIPGLLGGSIVVEFIFGINGMGKLAVSSIQFKDQEVVMAITLISGVLTLLANLVADLWYAVADPRVAYE